MLASTMWSLKHRGTTCVPPWRRRSPSDPRNAFHSKRKAIFLRLLHYLSRRLLRVKRRLTGPLSNLRHICLTLRAIVIRGRELMQNPLVRYVSESWTEAASFVFSWLRLVRHCTAIVIASTLATL